MSTLVFLFACGALGASNWSIQDSRVHLNGEPFLIRGVNYDPVPFGTSPQVPPYGVYFMPLAAPVYERDLPLMRAMGTNTIRLVAGSNQQVFIQGQWVDTGDYGDFLNQCYNNGVNPIHVFLAFQPDPASLHLNHPDFELTKAGFLAFMERWKNHPAVAGMVLVHATGEGPLSGIHPDFWAGIGQIASALKTSAPNKLTLLTLADDGDPADNTSPLLKAAYQHRQALVDLDLIGIDCFRGPALGAEQRLPGNRRFSVLEGYQRSWPTDPKPLIISAFGVSWGTGGTSIREITSPTQIEQGEAYLRGNWNEIRKHFNQQNNPKPVVSGGLVTSWVDSWYKNTTAPDTVFHHNPNQPIEPVDHFPGGQRDDEWFGIMRINSRQVSQHRDTWSLHSLVPDPLIQRSAYWVLQTLWSTAAESVLTAKADASPVEGRSRYWNTWFGVVDETAYPWVYHDQHDWSYLVGETPDSVWIYDASLGVWLWTNQNTYPYLFHAGRQAWWFYFEGTHRPEWFYDFLYQEFISHQSPLERPQPGGAGSKGFP